MGLCLIVKSGGGVDTSSATASAEQILSGYTIYRNDNKITGNMTNVGTQTKSGLNAGGSVTISPGYHNGSGNVTTNTLASQTGADIPDSSWCLSGYTYWKDGSKGTGTMTNRGKKTWSLGVNGSQTIEGGWHDGSGAVSQSGIKSDGTWRMLTPKTSQQTLCNSSTYYTQNQWCAGNSNLTAANIKKDITIFGVKGTYVENTIWLIKNGVVTWDGGLWYIDWSYDEDTGISGGGAATTKQSPTTPNSSLPKVWQHIDWGGRNGNYRWSMAFANIIGSRLSYSGSSVNDITINGTIAGDFYGWSGFRSIGCIITTSSISAYYKYTPDSNSHTGEYHMTSSGRSIRDRSRWYGGFAPNAITIIRGNNFSAGSFDFYAKNLWIEKTN